MPILWSSAFSLHALDVFIYQQLVLYFCYPTNSLCMKRIGYFFRIFHSLLILFSYCDGTAHCTDPPETGPCRAHFTRWYYDPLNKKCHHFIFGGCDGNENNFETTDKCMSNCSGVTGMKSAQVWCSSDDGWSMDLMYISDVCLCRKRSVCKRNVCKSWWGPRGKPVR